MTRAPARRGLDAPPLVALGMGAALAGYLLLPGAPLALAALAGFAALAYVRPSLALAATLASVPLYLTPRDLGGLAFPVHEAALGATAAAVAVRALVRRDVPLVRTPFDPWVALLLAAALLSLLPSEYLKLSLRSLRTLILEPVLYYYLVVALCPSGTALRPLVLGLVGAGALEALLACGQVALNVHTVQVEGVRRALGTYLSPNHLGLYLGRALPFAVALALWAPRGRAWYAGAAASIGAALGLTFSAGAWLGAAASLLVLAAVHGRRALLVTSLGGAAAGAVVLAALARLGVERITGQLTLEGSTATFRRQIWTSALAMLRDHPLLGIGLDNFLYRYRLEYILPAAWQEPNISHPHNWVLHFWLELGLLGLVAALGLLGVFGWLALSALRARPPSPDRPLVAAALASTVGLLVHGSLDNSYFLPDLALLFWTNLAVVALARGTCAGGALGPKPQSTPRRAA